MAIIKNPFMVVGEKNPLIANTEDELNALLLDKNTGKAVSYNGNMYVIEESDTGTPKATQLYTSGGSGGSSGDPITVNTEEELNALDTADNVGKFVSYSDGLYIITEG